MFSKMLLIAFITLFQIIKKAFIFLIFRSFMIASLIVKNWLIKTLKKIIKKSFSFCSKDFDFEFLKIVNRLTAELSFEHVEQFDSIQF
jgi:small-conductance mechanosensitive channel